MKTIRRFFAIAASVAALCVPLSAQTAGKHYDIGDKGPGGGYVFYYSEEGFPVYDYDFGSPVICHFL